ncbi:DUF2062 domain-containing protein [Aurantiacibacter gangjinensis]|uniref:Membrane protein n=1 Tax=Aurantiacibacter gangjinensis TaxID=502682 RepID=A0A0G9MTN5_9SPHN|nr:DUF2062 domain-containing protein [Aurantiacibacter gangjinensis]APE28402.1 hypothetical protein BMF35_a1573 [Aurantiacibacter gangjinensis]KLE32628.1 membrane protein [Aurantiacibacter gangjinensis]
MASKVTDWLKRRLPALPKREEMAKNRWLSPVAGTIARSELWRFTRRSVPRGVALGVFAAFIIPLGQTLLAVVLALPSRANLPLAAVTTLITNPFTIAFWAVIANRVGNFVLKIDAETGGMAGESMRSGWLQEFAQWASLAGVTAFGFLVLAIVGAALGYLIAGFAWRFVVAKKWGRRGLKDKALAPAE